MSAPVSFVVPALRPSEHLARALATLRAVLGAREGLDEIVVVDDSGQRALIGWTAQRAPGARVIDTGRNLGFAGALEAGIEAARHELVFCMNSDLSVRAGFLEPLVQALEDAEVFAAVPRVLRRGDPDGVESLVRMEACEDDWRVRQPCVEEPRQPPPERALAGPRPVPFALGGACLLRRSEYLEAGGMDALFEPFYLEDLDLGWRAWRAGRRCVHVSASVVEHLNQGTIAEVAPRALVLAAIEKNQLLFQWKHLETGALAAHVDALERRALDAWLDEERAPLEVLALALDQLDDLLESRAAQDDAVAPFAELARRSDPFAG